MNRQTKAERGCERCAARSGSVHPRKTPIGLRCPSEPALWAGAALIIVAAALLLAVIVAKVALAVLR